MKTVEITAEESREIGVQEAGSWSKMESLLERYEEIAVAFGDDPITVRVCPELDAVFEIGENLGWHVECLISGLEIIEEEDEKLAPVARSYRLELQEI